MNFDLKYGNETKSINIEDEYITQVLTSGEKARLDDPRKNIEQVLENPVQSPPLQKLLKDQKPKDIAIIVNDITRPTPYEEMLPPLLQKIHAAGPDKDQVKFIIATGVHPSHTREENIEVLGEKVVSKYEVISHDCDRNVKKIGELSSGNPLLIKKEVLQADFVITTGVIVPHYFAGFSGGRKSIMPGVAGRKTIENNHSSMVKLMDLDDVNLKNNPVHREMMEAVEMVGIDFILNVVTNSDRKIVDVTAGEWLEAWKEGIASSREMYEVKIEKKADITIASCGGHPRDINIYQAQKALEHAERATREGGIIILLAKAPEGYGDDTFKNWMKEAKSPADVIERIQNEFVIGGHKAFAICKSVQINKVYLISEIEEKEARELFMKKYRDLTRAYEDALKNLPDDLCINIIPNGALVVPSV